MCNRLQYIELRNDVKYSSVVYWMRSLQGLEGLHTGNRLTFND